MEGNMFNRHEITNILCKNLKFVRKNTQIENYQGKKYLSQAQLAKMLGYKNPQQISKYELGVDKIRATQLYRLSKIFDVPIEKFFDEKFSEQPYSKIIQMDIYD